MPCDTTQTMSVQEELKNLDPVLLKAALESMGFKVTVTNGVLRYSGVHKESGVSYTGSYQKNKFTAVTQSWNKPLEINAVKRAYSAQIVQKSAMTFGWKLTKTGANTYTAVKQ